MKASTQSRIRRSVQFSAFLCSLLATVSFPHAQEVANFPTELSSTDFLNNLTWKSDDNLNQIIASWPKFSGPQGFQDKSVEKRTTVKLLGGDFMAEYRVFHKDNASELVFFSDEQFPREFCGESLNWATGKFGQPEGLADIQTETAVKIRGSWRLGNTRVRLVCIGYQGEMKFISGLAILAFAPLHYSIPVENLAYIECSGTQRNFAGASDLGQRDGTPFSLIIDSNEKVLLKRDGLPFLQTDQFSQDEIKASEKIKTVELNFALDRITGSYKYDVIFENQSGRSEEHGKCSKVDKARKF